MSSSVMTYLPILAVSDDKRIVLLAANLPRKRVRSALAHNHENFNLHGAFYMDRRAGLSAKP